MAGGIQGWLSVVSEEPWKWAPAWLQLVSTPTPSACGHRVAFGLGAWTSRGSCGVRCSCIQELGLGQWGPVSVSLLFSVDRKGGLSSTLCIPAVLN